MTRRIDPLSPISGERRRVARRQRDPAPDTVAPEQQIAGLPALIPGETAHASEPTAPPPAGGAVFAAQVMGQEGQKRGLRGGPPVLQQARSAYLETEWSGRLDRRPKRGQVTKTEI